MERNGKKGNQLSGFDSVDFLASTDDALANDKNWGIPDELPRLRIQKELDNKIDKNEEPEKQDDSSEENAEVVENGVQESMDTVEKAASDSTEEQKDDAETTETSGEEKTADGTQNAEEADTEVDEVDTIVLKSSDTGDGDASTQEEIDALAEEERDRIRQERREKRRKKRKRQRILRKLTFALVFVAALGTTFYLAKDKINISTGQQGTGNQGTQTVANQDAGAVNTAVTVAPTATPDPEALLAEAAAEVLDQAALLAAQYDYDAAISLLKAEQVYDTNADMQAAVKEYEEIKATCVSWPLEEVTHVFYHTLIKDASKCFDGDYKEANYNQVMTTIDEFNAITQSMYDKGFVMVSMKDMATANEDGTITRGEILLPPGKIPFVLSQDDVSYYHYMDGDGFATKLIVDEEGKVRNEYLEDDGSISVGDYDMVPLIDRFVEAHPDFSYRGAKGVIALTGYNGVLGYRTDISYETRPDDLDEVKVKYLEANPDFNLEEERAAAKKVADTMKENGWEFASHTWGHLNVYEISMERLQADTARFKENVDPIIGGTDMIIFAFGADLTQIEDYSGEKFEYLKNMGYNYFCNVDSSKYFVQIRDNYFRMGRRNLDGYRMYYNPELVDDLFDANAVLDSGRPLPIAPMG